MKTLQTEEGFRSETRDEVIRVRKRVRNFEDGEFGTADLMAARDTALCVGLSASWRVATAGEGTVTDIQIGLQSFF